MSLKDGVLMGRWKKSKSVVLLSLLSVSAIAEARLARTFPERAFDDPPRAGGPINGLTDSQLQMFGIGTLFAGIPHSVLGTEPNAPVLGLGPRFNGTNCISCHSQPAPGGSSPATNPQVALATEFGAKNKVPFFVTLHGPVREARFRFNPDGTPDGGVHGIYTITGRQDAVGCNIAQPDFDAQAAANNLSFRIPTPMFGGGLVEQIPEAEIMANKDANKEEKQKLGIFGHENRNGNDGTVTRFGWKAQNISLEMFSAEAYNVEQGITNDLFQGERDETAGCVFNPVPEDIARFDVPPPFTGLSAKVAFVQFSKFLAPPQRAPITPSIQKGEALFNKVGCALCHTPTLHTGPTTIEAFSNKPVNLFSDLLVHHMGPKLADYVTQGNAGPDEFRSAPLWGLGQRLFYLHDGRTSDLVEAILAHASSKDHCHSDPTGTSVGSDGVACESEANGVIHRFKKLSNGERDDLMNFLKSL
jgi:CxxC motif-containing protein (DUF1111 family)